MVASTLGCLQNGINMQCSPSCCPHLSVYVTCHPEGNDAFLKASRGLSTVDDLWWQKDSCKCTA